MLTTLVKLTDWETGEAIYVKPAAIRSIRQLVSSSAIECGDETPIELSRRTRIDTNTDVLLVREDAETVMELIERL